MRLVDTEDVIDALGNMEEPIDLKEAEEWIDTVPTAMQLWTSVKTHNLVKMGFILLFPIFGIGATALEQCSSKMGNGSMMNTRSSFGCQFLEFQKRMNNERT